MRTRDELYDALDRLPRPIGKVTDQFGQGLAAFSDGTIDTAVWTNDPREGVVMDEYYANLPEIERMFPANLVFHTHRGEGRVSEIKCIASNVTHQWVSTIPPEECTPDMRAAMNNKPVAHVCANCGTQQMRLVNQEEIS